MVCKMCGKCCLQYAISAEPEDIQRWKRQDRNDILMHVMIFETSIGPFGDVLPSNTRRCPFLRKIKNQDIYRCRIQDTKPIICSKYPRIGKCSREKELKKNGIQNKA